MVWFSNEFERFFQELKENNNKEWFDENKKRYEKHVKKPFQQFVEELIRRLQEQDPEVQVQAKDCIFRINRDIRFSADKTPYKTQVSAVVSKGGRKDMSPFGFYIEMSDGHLRVYGGAYMPEKEHLQAIRQEILYDNEEFQKLVGSKEFKKYFGEMRGDKNKRLQPEFAEMEAKQPLIANKQFYYFCDLDPKFITSDQLADKVMEVYEVSKPVQAFLHRAYE